MAIVFTSSSCELDWRPKALDTPPFIVDDARVNGEADEANFTDLLSSIKLPAVVLSFDARRGPFGSSTFAGLSRSFTSSTSLIKSLSFNVLINDAGINNSFCKHFKCKARS